MNQLRSILSQFKELYLRMNGAQRLSIGLFVCSVLLVMVVFLMQATKSPGDKVLFYSVSNTQAADITEKLKDMGVQWDYRNGAILVGPQENIDRLKMSLAQDDLLPDDLEYDFSKIVNDNSPMLTDQERKRNFDIALQTEVAKVLMSMDSIDFAKVIISKEEPSPLLKRHERRTASVNVSVRGKRSLTNPEVKAIVRLVASSVKGLSTERVSVSDSRGRSYDFDPEGGATEKFALKRELEEKLSRKIENYLLEFIPKAKATVAINLDMSKLRKEIKDYQHKDLNGGAATTLISSLSEKEESNTKEGSQGVVGAGTNSSADIKEGDGSSSVMQKKSKKQEQLDSSVVQVFLEEDNKMDVLSVAVVVANRRQNPNFDPAKPEGEDNQEFPEHKWVEADLVKQIANIVAVKPEKVSLTIQEMMIARTPAPPTFWQGMSNWFEGKMVFLMMFVFASAGSFFLVKMVKKAEPEEEILPMPEYEEEDKEDNLPPLEEPDVDPKMRQIENRVKEIIEDDPQKAASLIRNWLSNE